MKRHPSDPEFAEDGVTGLSARDWLGNRFFIDDPVIFCISNGHNQMMAVGQVCAIRSKKVTEWTGLVYDDVTVLVRTAATSGSSDNKARAKATWVNPRNVTSLRGLVRTATRTVNDSAPMVRRPG